MRRTCLTPDVRKREVEYARGMLEGPDGYVREPLRRHLLASMILGWAATLEVSLRALHEIADGPCDCEPESVVACPACVALDALGELFP